MRRRRILAGCALAVALLATTACGSGTSVTASSGDDTPTRLSESTATSTGTGPGPSPHPTAPTHLEGRIVKASEGSCLHLQSDGVVYELIGATTGLVVGRDASVVGRVDHTVQSQCGGGVPFVVTSGAPRPSSGG